MYSTRSRRLYIANKKRYHSTRSWYSTRTSCFPKAHLNNVFPSLAPSTKYVYSQNIPLLHLNLVLNYSFLGPRYMPRVPALRNLLDAYEIAVPRYVIHRNFPLASSYYNHYLFSLTCTSYLLRGRVADGFSSHRSRFKSRVGHMGVRVNKFAMGYVIPWAFYFPCHLSFYKGSTFTCHQGLTQHAHLGLQF
jgi:hypothetical protein